MAFEREDRRPAFVLEDVNEIGFSRVKAPRTEGVPAFILMNVEQLAIDQCAPTRDVLIEKAQRKEL